VVRLAIILTVLAWSGSTFAATRGQNFQEAFDYAAFSCPEAFAAHKAHWPPADATRKVIWQNPGVLNDNSESPFDTPLSDDIKRILAWEASQYVLMDDFLGASSYALRPTAEPDRYSPAFEKRAETLSAAADLYFCLRPTPEVLAAFIAMVGDMNAQTAVGADTTYTDCMGEKAKEMVVIVHTLEPLEVHAALQPYRNAHEDCRSTE
jgi:hypothetical protein